MKDNPWWLMLIQGIVGVALALYIFFARDQAVLIIGLIAAAYVFVMGLVQTIAGYGTGGSKTLMYRGIAGMIIGALLFGMYFLNLGTVQSGYTLLAIGLIVFGALGLWANFFDRGQKDFEWGPIIINGALLLWGVLIFFTRSREIDLANASAWILLIAGGAGIAWSFVMRNQEKSLPSSN